MQVIDKFMMLQVADRLRAEGVDCAEEARIGALVKKAVS